MLVVIILGSPSDRTWGQQIEAALTEFSIPSETRIASAHKTPQRLLEIVQSYEASRDDVVYITVAGRSNALSGMVDAHVAAPVIACPPYSDRYGGADVWSSLRTPSGVAPAVVLDAENAALLAAKILALNNPQLREKVRQMQNRQRSRLMDADGSTNGQVS